MSHSLDPLVTAGTLDNGLQYFIRENAHPADRLELRLVVNAGSVLEDDDQRGLAHFVEHMLFNGTERFPRQTLVEFFERIGMRFGPDINAYTSFDETVYMIQVPTDSLPIVRQAFEVLQDWASRATLDPEETDRERGVLIEEWRRGRGAAGRIRDQVLPLLLENSRYAERQPIGDVTILKEGPHEAVRRFYKTWYRPELMAIVLVGDLSTDFLEQMVHEHFAELKNPTNPRPRPQFSLPTVKKTRYRIIRDRETTVTNFSINFRQPTQTTYDYRERILTMLSAGMFNRRVAAIARDGTTSPFLWARMTARTLVRNQPNYALDGQTHEDSLLAGIAAGLREIVRLSQHGFTESELVRQKRVVMSARERIYNERDYTTSDAFARVLVQHYLTGIPEPGIEHEFALVKEILPTITLSEVNAFLRDKLSSSDRLVVVTMPDKPGTASVASQNIESTLNEVLAQTYAPYENRVAEGPLMTPPPTPAKVVHSRFLEESGATEIVLENSVRVIMKSTDFKAQEVLFAAYRNGGSSHYDDSEYFDATFASVIVQRSGISTFDQNMLREKLAGQVVTVAPYITEFSEGFSGRTANKDLETLFQLIHLYVTQPRADETALRSFQNHQRAMIVNRNADPASAFADSLFRAFYADHRRRRILTEEDLNQLSAERSLEIFRERLADVRDFTFVFVGSFTVETVQQLAQTYLGTLPSQVEPISWRDVEPALPEGVVTKTAYKGQEPQSRVGIVFHGPFEYSPANEHLIRSLRTALNMRLREELREARGGTYDVSVQVSTPRIPREQYMVSIYFGCDPDRVEELARAVFEEIDKIKADAPLEDYVVRIQEQQRRAHKVQMKTNGFWRSILMDAYRYNMDMLPALHYEELVDALTVQDIRDAARTWLTDQYIRVALMPSKHP